jgi:protein-S-isoprenylcysteine O-methyltransferase Ste14
MKNPLPPTWFLGAIAAMAVCHFLVPAQQLVTWPWRLAGIVPVVAGAVLNVLADRAFKRYQTTVKPFEVSTELVTSGVFRISRHPMYLGMVLVLGGIALLLGSLTPWLIFPVFMAAMELLFIRVEENMLTSTFGDAYLQYKAQVRKWL